MQVKLIDREAIVYFTDQLQHFEKDKAIKSGLRAAVNVFRVKGRSNLRSRLLHHGVQTGHLMNSFTTRVKRNKLGALAGFDKWGSHSHLVDLGTKHRYTKGKKSIRAGADRGIMKGNSFWTDAKKSEEEKAIRALYKGVERAVERINNRR